MPRKPHKYHYIYKITCLKNGRYYIGMHSTSNLDDGYMGSGRKIRDSISYYGINFHEKEIIEFLPDRTSLINREIEIINEDLLNDPMCMNIRLGGENGWEQKSRSLGAISANKKNWQDPEFREKMKKVSSSTFKKLWEEEKLLTPDWTGRKHSEESKRKMSVEASKRVGELNSQFGTCWVNKLGVYKKIKSSELDDHILSGWERGRKGYNGKLWS